MNICGQHERHIISLESAAKMSTLRCGADCRHILEACHGQYLYSPAESRQAGAFQQDAGFAKARAVPFYMEKSGMIDAIDRTNYCVGPEKQRAKRIWPTVPVAAIDQKMPPCCFNKVAVCRIQVGAPADAQDAKPGEARTRLIATRLIRLAEGSRYGGLRRLDQRCGGPFRLPIGLGPGTACFHKDDVMLK
jgi:hypothetical protein